MIKHKPYIGRDGYEDTSHVLLENGSLRLLSDGLLFDRQVMTRSIAKKGDGISFFAVSEKTLPHLTNCRNGGYLEFQDFDVAGVSIEAQGDGLSEKLVQQVLAACAFNFQIGEKIYLEIPYQPIRVGENLFSCTHVLKHSLALSDRQTFCGRMVIGPITNGQSQSWPLMASIRLTYKIIGDLFRCVA